MNSLKKLASQTAIYGVSSLLGRAINYLLVPYYTSVFVAAEYGIINELYAYVAFFNVLFTFGLETAYFRFSNKKEFSENEIYNSSLSLILIIVLVGSGLLIFFSSFLASIIQFPDKANFIVWLAIIIAIDAIVAIPFARLRHQNKAKKYAGIRILNVIINIGLNIFFITICKGISEGKFLTNYSFLGSFYNPEIGVGYVFISNLIANALYLPLLYKCFIGYKFQLIKKQVQSLFHYSYPLMFMGLAGIANEVIDRPMIKNLWKAGYEGITGVEANGIYGACYKIATLMTLGIQAMRYAVEPFVFSQSNTKNAPETYAKIMNWFVLIACFLFLFLSLNIEWIGNLFIGKEEYKEGLKVVPILLLANLFLGIYINLSLWFKLTEKTYWGTIIALFGAIITFVGNYMLIPQIGYLGSAYTTLACYFLMVVVSFIIGQKYFPVPYKVMFNAMFIALSIIIVWSIKTIKIEELYLKYIITLIIPIIFAIGMFLTNKNIFLQKNI